MNRLFNLDNFIVHFRIYFKSLIANVKNMNCCTSKKFPFTQKGYRNVVNVEIDILKYWKNLKRIDFLHRR